MCQNRIGRESFSCATTVPAAQRQDLWAVIDIHGEDLGVCFLRFWCRKNLVGCDSISFATIVMAVQLRPCMLVSQR